MKKFLPILLLLSSFFTTSAHAQVGQTFSGLSSINSAIRGGKGTVNAVGSGAIVTSKGDVLVQPSNLVIPVQGKATISAASVAVGIVGCIPPLTTVGGAVCAASVATIASELAQANFVKCAMGDTGFCKQTQAVPEGQGAPNAPGWYGAGAPCQSFGCTIKQACESQIPVNVGPLSTFEFDRMDMDPSGVAEANGYKARGTCYARRIASPEAKYNSGVIMSQQIYVPPLGGTAPATGNDIVEALKQRQAADNDTVKRILDAINKDLQSNPTTYPPYANPYKNDVPYEVTAPPATGTEEVVKTRTITNPDGTTSTETTKEVVKVTPTTTGSTLGDSKTTFPSTTTTTVTTTNNTTNQTIVGPTTVTHAPSIPAEKLEIPDDYNREVTQQKILKAVDGSDMPETSKFDKDSDLQKIDDKNKELANSPTGITESSLGLGSWLPTFPTAACSNPSFANPVTGSMVEMNICDYYSIAKSVVSGILIILMMYGAVREVQSTLG